MPTRSRWSTSSPRSNPVTGMIPVAYAPCSVVLDQANNSLIVANDKGIGTRYSFETDHGVTGYNTHQDNGTVSILPVPNNVTLNAMTSQVFENNHWDLTQNIQSAAGGSSAGHAGRTPREDRRSVADQARVPDHP